MSYQRRKVRVGRVIGDKMDKTCIVEVEWRSFHRRYKKSIRRRSRFKAHDENNTAQLGDTVTIIESRPTSKTKRWRLVNIIDRQEIAELPPMDIAPAEEMEASMPEPAVEETVSQEEDAPAPVEAVDEAPDEPAAEAPEEPVDADVDEGDADVEPSDEADTSEETVETVAASSESADEEDTPVDEEPEAEDAVEETTESADGEEVPADEPSEPQDEVEAIVESVDEEDAPAQEEEESEAESAEMPESAEEVEAPSDESETVDEKADEEKPRQ